MVLICSQNACRFTSKDPLHEGVRVVVVANMKASPPGRHHDQEQASQLRCTRRPTTFSSVQFSRQQRCTCTAIITFSAVQRVQPSTTLHVSSHYFIAV